MVPIGTLKKVTAETADICRLAQDAGQALSASAGLSPAGFLENLIGAAQLNEAVQFLAFALPKREAVWWACVCARKSGMTFPPADLAALEAAEAWVYRPTEENRRTAMDKALATKFESAAVWPAVAAFWSGPSMAPANLPAVPPPPHLTGVAVAGAVTLAAVQREPQLAEEKRRLYIDVAIDIANGGSGRLEAKSG